MKKSGRSFDCSTCPVSVQKLRRCSEDRWDFDHNDGAIWPMSVTPGGDLFGFCPGKATWDFEAVNLFRLLVVAFELKQSPNAGGLLDQPGWFVELMSAFGPAYDNAKFMSRARSILGDGEKGKTTIGHRPASRAGRGKR